MALTVSATDTEVQKPVNIVYQQQLLRNARPLAPYFLGTTPGVVTRNAGTATIKWRRYNTSFDNASGIAPTTTALSELTGVASYMQGRDADVVHFSDVVATIAKYGQFYILNEEVDVFLPNGTMSGIVRTLSISAGRSLNQLQRDIGDDNATILQVGAAASDGAQGNIITLNAIKVAVETLHLNAAMTFNPMATGSPDTGTVPMLPSFWLLCHPYVAADITGISGFNSVAKYAGQVAVAPGEFGEIDVTGFAVRCVQSQDATVDANSGSAVPTVPVLRGATNHDLFTTLVYGMDAIGSVGLGRSFPDGIFRAGDENDMFELIAKGVGVGRPSGTDDPFDEITTLAWKAWHTGAITNGNWVRAIRSGATLVTA